MIRLREFVRVFSDNAKLSADCVGGINRGGCFLASARVHDPDDDQHEQGGHYERHERLDQRGPVVGLAEVTHHQDVPAHDEGEHGEEDLADWGWQDRWHL